MKKHDARITAKSVEQSGLPSDYRKAIAEYIWNGFDARASSINIDFQANELGYLNSFSISDNGKGVNINEIDSTFGHFLDSQKTQSFNADGFIKGKKGKGRFSFSHFCNSAQWNTTFLNAEDRTLHYKISISKGSLHNYSIGDRTVIKNKSTGTKVEFFDFFNLSAQHLDSKEFLDFLSSEFGWFLHLNKGTHSISINGKPIEYESIIDDSENYKIEIGEFKFDVSYIRWNVKIGDKYYFYYLNGDKKEVGRKHTSFNNKAIDFHHSMYVNSTYFDSFKLTDSEEPVLGFAGKNQTDATFKALAKKLGDFLVQKEKDFIREQQAQNLIAKYHAAEIFPKFKNNEYERLRLKDLENVVKEIYCIQPKIFQGLRKESSKTLVGFLNLLLDSEEREKVLEIMDEVVSMTDEERSELVKVLRKSKLSNLVSIVKLLHNRLDVVQTVKHLVFDLEPFTNERDHIQKVVEENYWLFGEEFHLVSADKNFETVLNNYMHFIESGEQNFKGIEGKKRLRRPDIFMCRKMSRGSSAEDSVEDNIIVELKRPNVIIGQDQYRQIEDYLRIIIDEPRFNSELRHWKFYLVGKDVDSFIKDKYESKKDKGKKFLVESVRNYEIYALKWDDVFRMFENRHKYIIDKLEYKSEVLEELKALGISMDREMSDKLTAKATI